MKLKNSISEKEISGDLTGNSLFQVGADYNEPYKFNAVDLFSLFQSLYKISKKQSRAYLFFEALWECQALFSVETSWKRFDNMAVETITPLRTDSADKTEFTITVKQMSFTQTKADSVENVVGRLKEMLGKSVNKGVDKGQETPTIEKTGAA